MYSFKYSQYKHCDNNGIVCCSSPPQLIILSRSQMQNTVICDSFRQSDSHPSLPSNVLHTLHIFMVTIV